VPRLRPLAALGLLVGLLTIFVFLPVGHFGFSHYDDRPYIAWNAHVRTGVSADNAAWAFTTFYQANWHPLTWISHMVDVELFGLDPGMHHLTNLGLHVTNTCLLFALFTMLTGSPWRSALLAALFGVHPLHVESVAWIAERKDVLSTLLLLLTLAAYLRYVRHPRRRQLAVVTLAFGCGLLAKPMLVTLPFVLLLIDWWPLGRAARRAPHRSPRAASDRWLPLIREKTPLLFLAAAASAVTLFAQRRGGAMQTMDAIPLGERLANAVVSYGSYLAKTVWPAGLGVMYPFPPGGPPWWKVAVSLAALGTISWAIVRWRKTRPFVTIGWLWYLGTLIPVIGLVQVGNQALADRYTYVPLIGVFMAAAWLLGDLELQRASKAICVSAVGLVVVALAVTARVQVGYWRDGTTLYRHTLRVTDGNWAALLELGTLLATQGKLAEAEDDFRRVLKIKPELAEARNNLGLVLLKQGRREEAETAVASAIQADPGSATAHYNLGLIQAQAGRRDAALESYRTAVTLKECYAAALNNLGNALDEQGKGAEAERSYREALRCEPDYAEAYYNLAVLLADQKRIEEAVVALAAALRFRPEFPEAADLLRRLGGSGITGSRRF